MKKMILAICVVTIIFTGVGCSKEASLDVSLEDLLSVLDNAEIQYAERTESRSAYDLQREGAERHLYQLEPGNLTIYIFPTINQRREVQSDPFPTAGAVPPNGSYDMGRILVFYYNGDEIMAQKLLAAFEPLGGEDRSQLQ
ncbi:hypothetical protein [Paenibacillus sp. An7]|uniref:hypothetical protein n=1 Tax=Paenibacillus sp. An7 TaxID=2689577 RepID=UPI001358AD1F|nr:hypothetical protein [Paenibacillus sp. An7]